jgi:dephospho-CoA kinase
VRIYGLTGGIASGKSTVAAMFTALGAPVIDADLLARRVVEPGQPALAEIAAKFGPEVLAADGTLARGVLGELVFADPDARRALEAITHPRIAALGRAAMALHRSDGHAVCIYEAALIVEKRLHETMDGLVVVSTPEEIQLERLLARDALDPVAARRRLAAQLPLAAKIAEADWVIDNGGDREATAARVAEVWDEMRRDTYVVG